MGLDMYFYAEKFISEHFDPELQAKVKPLIEEMGMDYTPSNITINLMYWRKANQIHNWFVTNVQNGVDDCQRHDVYRDHLIELKEVIDQVLADTSKAEKLLPPQSGFFFGSVEIDEWYWRDLEDTRDKLEKLIEQSAEGGPLATWDFYYRSSW